jgi:hypothetical protein
MLGEEQLRLNPTYSPCSPNFALNPIVDAGASEGAVVRLKDPHPVIAKKPRRVAIVIANPAVSSTSGWLVGFSWSELSHPYFAYIERGYQVAIISRDGGKCQADAMSEPRGVSGTPKPI